jgi:eukaryotic translation initiation factor 2C
MSGRGRGRGKGRGRGRGSSQANPGGSKRPGRSTGTAAREEQATQRPGGSGARPRVGEQPTPIRVVQKPTPRQTETGQQETPRGHSEGAVGLSTSGARIQPVSTGGHSKPGAIGSTSGAKAVKQPPTGGPRLERDFGSKARVDQPIDSGTDSRAERSTSASTGASSNRDTVTTLTVQQKKARDHTARLPGPPSESSVTKAASSVSGATSSSKVKGPANYHGKKQPPDRPDVGTKGRTIVVRTNFFPVKLPSEFTVYHYDVSITPKLPKRLNRIVYEHLMQKHLGGQGGAYDGSKSLYCRAPLKFQGENLKIETQVPIPNEDPAKPKKVTVIIKQASQFDVDHSRLQEIFRDASQKMPIIQALDVAFRHMSSLRMEPIGRSFFSPPSHPFLLGQGREVWSGHYQSVRPASGWKLMLNVDVASTAFYTEQPVIDFMCAVLKENRRDYKVTDEDRHRYTCRPLHDKDRAYFSKEIKGVKIEVTHLPYPRKYKVNGVTRESARDRTFPLDNGTQCTVEKYFATNYAPLTYPHLPCLHVGSPQRNIFIPLELCKIVGGQRCVKKLTDVQTAQMIRHTAQPADVRERRINSIVKEAKFNDDPLVKEFGMTVSSEMVSVPARVLQPPTLQYDQNTIRPLQDKGSWDMRDSKFFKGAKVEGWAVVNCSWYCRNEYAIKKFTSELEEKCSNMGMQVKSRPVIDKQRGRESVEEMVRRLRRDIPDLNLVVAVIDKGSPSYFEIKQVGDTNDGLAIATQCVLSDTVQKKCNPSTIANICLKINAKLGGVNNTIASSTLPRLLREEPVIIFGADVTHPKSGDTTTPSIASVVASIDFTASKFRAKHHAQKHRQEVIAQLKDMAKELLLDFYRETNKTKPNRIIFYRDGVSEGQFEQIRLEEVAAIQQACLLLEKDYRPGITFIVVQKRHHTRLFPTRPQDAIGKGKNVPPGTTVDTKITHPFEFDFYLCSHAAIQGTSRPCHFHVLWDDNDFTADDLQLLSYQLCHTFWRCNRSVSYPAPAYYAHRDAAHAKTLMQAQESSSDSASVSSGSTRSEADVDRAITIHKDRKDRMYFL